MKGLVLKVKTHAGFIFLVLYPLVIWNNRELSF